MKTFKDIVKKDIQRLFNVNEFADDVLYNNEPKLAIYELQQTNQKGSLIDTQGMSDVSYFWIQLDEKPKTNDKITYNGTIFLVSRVVEKNFNVYKIEVETNTRPTANRFKS